MNGRSTTTGWVVCTSCQTIYAPINLGFAACPRCGDMRWEPAEIRSGDDPVKAASR